MVPLDAGAIELGIQSSKELRRSWQTRFALHCVSSSQLEANYDRYEEPNRPIYFAHQVQQG
jgi:hypothetical protein